MRYYTFMARLITEPPLPAHMLFNEEEGQISKEKVSVFTVFIFIPFLSVYKCRKYYAFFIYLIVVFDHWMVLQDILFLDKLG